MENVHIDFAMDIMANILQSEICAKILSGDYMEWKYIYISDRCRNVFSLINPLCIE